MKKLILGITVVFLSTVVQSQNKDEREIRVNQNDFPELAVALVKTLPEDLKKIKFYKETDGTHKSYELKFKYQNHRYSLEFDSNGSIEDIEKTIKFKFIKKGSKSNIETYFANHFSKSKIIKCQEQYIYAQKVSPKIFINAILANTSKTDFNFEIIAEVKKDSKRSIREFTFDNSGKFLNFRILNPTSYEHVLY